MFQVPHLNGTGLALSVKLHYRQRKSGTGLQGLFTINWNAVYMYANLETGRPELMEVLDFRPNNRKDGTPKPGRDVLNFVQSPADFSKFLNVITRFHNAVQDLPRVYNVPIGLFKLDFTKLTLDGIPECLIPIIPIEARELYLKFRTVPEFCTMEELTMLEHHFADDERVKVGYLTRLQVATQQQKQLANIKEKKGTSNEFLYTSMTGTVFTNWYCLQSGT